jgi:hypothetical protein
MNPETGLKWSAAFFALFWAAGMLLWCGVFSLANVVITTIGGAVAGYLWYRIMRRVFIGRQDSAR